MAVILYKIHGKYNNANHRRLLLDSDSDFNSLPGLETCAVGSVAESISSGAQWILCADGTWKEFYYPEEEAIK